ncbi:MAG: hypothetical protein A2284_06055 [Deltaproteobacteria bacterium RIFOXYA12_FULL_61_11]|nr:MAG: hypothetical protein A2284_06055 [Deltaproteobacteria bacterium RIFOXYA12_FULL_61_11]
MVSFKKLEQHQFGTRVLVAKLPLGPFAAVHDLEVDLAGVTMEAEQSEDEELLRKRSVRLVGMRVEVDVAGLETFLRHELTRDMAGLKNLSLSVHDRHLSLGGTFQFGKHQTFFTFKGYLYKSLDNKLTILFYDPMYYGAIPSLHYELLRTLLWQVAPRVKGSSTGCFLKVAVQDPVLARLEASMQWTVKRRDLLYTNDLAGTERVKLHIGSAKKDDELCEISDMRLLELVEAKSLYQKGDDLIEARKYDEARRYFEEVIGQKFYNTYALTQLAMLYLVDKEEYALRITDINEFLSGNPTNPSLLNVLASLYVLTGQEAEALATYKKIDTLLGRTRRLRLDQVYCKLTIARMLKVHDGQRAVEYLQQELANVEGEPELRRELVELLKERGEWERLIPLLEEEVRLRKQREGKLELLKEIAFLYLDKLGNYLKAKEFLQRLAERLNKETIESNLEIIEGLARCHEGLGNADKAVGIYEGLIKKLRDSDYKGKVHLALGALFEHKLGNAAAALEQYEYARKLLPSDRSLLETMVRLLAPGDWNEHRQEVEHQLARVLLESGELERAVSSYQGLVRGALGRGDKTTATRFFLEAIRLSPGNTELLNLGKELDLRGKHSRELLDQVAAQVNGLEDLGDLGCYLRLVPDPDDWLTIVRKLKQNSLELANKAHKARILMTIGLIYDEVLKDAQKGNEYFQSALKLAALGQQSLVQLKAALRKDQRWQRLQEILQLELESTEKPSLRSSLLFELGDVQLKGLGQLDKAMEFYEQALHLWIDSLPLLRNRHLGLQAEGAHEAASKLLAIEHKLVENPIFRPYLLHDFGVALQALEDAKGAEKFFKKAASLEPNNLRLMQSLGLLYVQQDEYLNAIRVFHKVYQLVYEQFNFRPTDTLALNFVRIARFQKNPFKGCDLLSYSRNLLRSYLLERDALIDALINFAMGAVHQFKFVKIEKAREFYARTINVYPAHLYTLTNLTQIHKLTNNYDEIERLFREAVEFLHRVNAKELPEFLEQLDELCQHHADAALTERYQRVKTRADELASEADITNVGEKTVSTLLQQLKVERDELRENLYQPRRMLRIANLSRRMSDLDQAYIFYAVHQLFCPEDEESKRFVSEHKRRYSELSPERFDSQVYEEYILHPFESALLFRLLKLITPALLNLYDCNAMELHGLSAEDQITEKSDRHLRRVFDQIRKLLGVTELTFYVRSGFQDGLAMEPSKPPTLVLAAEWLAELSPSEQRFLLAKHIFLVRSGHHLYQKLGAENLHRILTYLCKMYLEVEGIGPFDQEEYTRFASGFRKREHLCDTERLYEALQDFQKVMDDVEVERHLRGVEYTSDRVGLLASNEIRSAINVLAQLDPDLSSIAEKTGSELVSRFQACRPIDELLRYAVSEQYTKVRRIMNIALV